MTRGFRLSKRKREDALFTFLLLLPAGLIMAVVTIYPLIRSFIISLLRWDLTKPNLAHSFIGFDNYSYVLKDPTFWQSARITVLFVIGAVILEISLGLAVALLLNREFRGRNLVRMLALLPWAVPGVVNGIMWKWILNPSYGALNGALYSLGIIDKYIIWLGTPGSALIMSIFADVWKETPFIMLLLLAALQTIPKEMYEAATMDGANPIQAFQNVTVPLIKPTLFVALTLRTIWALKSFDLIYTLTAGGPSGGTTVIGYYTYVKTFVTLNLGRGSAVAYLMTAVVAILVILYQRALYQEVRY
ncbi:MAG TPA: sugar ABC transporter permease [Anaerolineaceae bacterium]|nr:sugar ABC transporter permease [Anaerolineaceae bacterium]